MTDIPNARETIDKAINANVAGIRTTFLAEVTAYAVNANNIPLVDVRPIVHGRDNKSVTYGRAVLTEIPYYPPSAGAFIIFAPLAIGDIVECCAFERSSVEYVINGSTDYAAGDPRRHSYADAYVRGKVRSRADALASNVSSAGSADLVIGFADGSSRIAIKASGEIIVNGTQVRLGSDTAASAVALNPEVLAQLQALSGAITGLLVWYNAGVASAVLAGVPVPAMFKPLDIPASPYTPALVGATKVKAI